MYFKKQQFYVLKYIAQFEIAENNDRMPARSNEVIQDLVRMLQK